MSSINTLKTESWGVALYDFQGNPKQRTLTIFAGDVIKVEVREDREWWPAVCNGIAGFVPKNYIKLRGNQPDLIKQAGKTVEKTVTILKTNSSNNNSDNNNNNNNNNNNTPSSPHKVVVVETRERNESSINDSLAIEHPVIKDDDNELDDDDDSDSETDDDNPETPQLDENSNNDNNSNNNDKIVDNNKKKDTSNWVKAVALYKFFKQEDRQLGFLKRDVLLVKPDDNIQWWEAERNGIFGLVPANYIRILKKDETVESVLPYRRGTLLQMEKNKDKKSSMSSGGRKKKSTMTSISESGNNKNKKKSNKSKVTFGALPTSSKTKKNDDSSDDDDDDDFDDNSNHNQKSGSYGKKNRMLSLRLRRAIAIESFVGISDNELSFNQGDYLDVEPKVANDWWPAIMNGNAGLVPRNFIRVVEEHKKGETLKQRRMTSKFQQLHEVSAYQRLAGNLGYTYSTFLGDSYSSFREIPFFSVLLIASDSNRRKKMSLASLPPLVETNTTPKFNDSTKNIFLEDDNNNNNVDESKENENLLKIQKEESNPSKNDILASLTRTTIPKLDVLEKQFKNIEKEFRFVILEDGYYVYAQNDLVVPALYLVIDGELEITVNNEYFDSIQAGQFFGETSLSLDDDYTQSTRTQTVKSKGQSALLELPYEGYTKLCELFNWFQPAVQSLANLRSGETLQLLPFFRNMDVQRADLLGTLFDFSVYSKNEILYQEGDKTREFFIVLKGTVSISITLNDGTKKEIQRIGPGSFFGESSLLKEASKKDIDNNKKSKSKGLFKKMVKGRNRSSSKETYSTSSSTIKSSPKPSSLFDDAFGSRSTSLRNSRYSSNADIIEDGKERQNTATVIEPGTILMKLNGQRFSRFTKNIDQYLIENFQQIIDMKSRKTLDHIPFLKDNIPDHKLDILASVFEYSTYEEGDVLFRAGDLGNRFFIVCEGEVELLDTRGELIMQQGKYDYFGEISLLEKKTRAATVVCLKSPTICITLSTQTFELFIATSPEVLTPLVHSISARAQAQNVIQGLIPTAPDELANVAHLYKDMFNTYEAELARKKWSEIGSLMSPCLRILRGHPQYVHHVPFQILRDPNKPFVITIVELSEDIRSLKISCKVHHTVSEVVENVFEKFKKQCGFSLDMYGSIFYGLKITGRADYLVDKKAELGRYKCITKALRRGLEKGELQFSLVDLRINPKNGPALKPVLSGNGSRIISNSISSSVGGGSKIRKGTSASMNDDDSLDILDAIALYDYEDGDFKMKKGDRIQVEPRKDGNSWLVAFEGKTAYIPRNYIKALQQVDLNDFDSIELFSKNRLKSGSVIENGLLKIKKKNSKEKLMNASLPEGDIATVDSNSSSISASKINLVGAPVLTIDAWAKSIGVSSLKVDEQVTQAWDEFDENKHISANNLAFPLRIKLVELTKIFFLKNFDMHKNLVVKIELVFAGEVIETKYSRPVKKNLDLYFDDEWISFERLIGHIPFGARICLSIIGLDDINVEQSLSINDTINLPSTDNTTNTVTPLAFNSSSSFENGFVFDTNGIIFNGDKPENNVFNTVLASERGAFNIPLSSKVLKLASGGGNVDNNRPITSQRGGTNYAIDFDNSVRKSSSSKKKISSRVKSMRGKKSTNKDNSSQDLDEVKNINVLGGVSILIWKPDLILNSGIHHLKLWSGEPGEKYVFCTPNPQPSSGELVIEFDKFAKSVRFDMPKKVNVDNFINQTNNKHRLKAIGGSSVNLKSKNDKGISKLGGSSAAVFARKRQKKKDMANRRKSTFNKKGGLLNASQLASLNTQIPKKVQELLSRDPLRRYKMTTIEKSLIWSEREKLVDDPTALTKFMLTVDWAIPQKRDTALALLEKWKKPTPMQAMELLGERFGELRLREYAVECLEPFDDDELSEFLLQLTQVLKYEAVHDSPLARFLLKRSLANPREIGNRFFWSLRAEMHELKYASRFGLLLQAYLQSCGAHIAELTQQHDVQELLKSVAESAQRQKFNSKTERNEFCQKQLENLNSKLPKSFQLALDPRIKVKQFNTKSCKVMSSKKRPLWLSLTNVDPTKNGAKPILVMFKAGDDLRQDQMTLQLLRVMDQIWLAEGINLRLTPYGCVSTGDELGMLEIVTNSDTTANIQKDMGGRLGAFKDTPIREWLKENNKQKFAQAVENFVHSCAGYCVATYVLGIGDRHSDNIMVKKDGHLFHIDFGHFLGNFKSKFGIKRERTAFVFTKEMAAVMGGKNGEAYNEFVDLCCEAFNLLRLHGDDLVNLFRLMIPSGIPELESEDDIQYLVDKLHLNLTDEQAAEQFKKEIDAALSDTYRRFDNFIHNIKTS